MVMMIVIAMMMGMIMIVMIRIRIANFSFLCYYYHSNCVNLSDSHIQEKGVSVPVAWENRDKVSSSLHSST